MRAAASADRLTVVAFCGVILFGALNPIAVRETVRELAPLWAGAVRFLLAGLLLVAVVLVSRRSFPRGRSLWGAMLYGSIAFAGFLGCLNVALRDVPVG